MGEDNHIEKLSHPDRVGKVFILLTRSTRLCLVCEGVFTSQAAADIQAQSAIHQNWLFAGYK